MMSYTPNPAAILAQLNLAVVIVDFGNDWHCLYLSPAAEALFGISFKRANHLNFAKLKTNAGELGALLENIGTTAQTITIRELELWLPLSPNSVTVDCTATLLDAKQLMLELAPLDRILRIAKEQHLQREEQANREMLRNMAHEVKNPLAGIRGAAQLLSRDASSESAMALCQIVITEVDRLQQLVDRMLGNNQSYEKSCANIHQLLEQVIKIVGLRPDKDIHFVRDYDTSLPEIWLEHEHILQVFLNIIDNAVHASSRHGKILVKTRVMRRFTTAGKSHKLVARISITDFGSGIEPELQERIFLPLVTGRADGTGLGLPIAQKLVARHDGIIECQSQKGRTTFDIYIPMRTGDGA